MPFVCWLVLNYKKWWILLLLKTKHKIFLRKLYIKHKTIALFSFFRNTDLCDISPDCLLRISKRSKAEWDPAWMQTVLGSCENPTTSSPTTEVRNFKENRFPDRSCSMLGMEALAAAGKKCSSIACIMSSVSPAESFSKPCLVLSKQWMVGSNPL